MANTTTIGALSVRITADSRGLKKGVKSAGDTLRKSRKTLNSSAKAFAKWGAAGTLAAVAIGTAIFKAQAKTIDALAKTSDKLGIATEQLAGLRFAAEQTGVTTATLDKALLKMTVGISEATTGTGLAKDALEQLGLSAESLSKKTPDEALNDIADAMEGVEKQSDKVRIAYDLFGAKGVGLINTVKGGSEALKGFQDEAEDLGIALTRVDAAKVEQANDALNRVSKVIDGALQEATVQLSPIVTALATAFTDSAKEAGGMGDQISDVFDWIIGAVGTVIDAIEGIERVFDVAGRIIAIFGLGVVDAMLTVADAIVNKPIDAINELIEAMNQLLFVDLEPVGLSGFGESIRGEMSIVRDAIEIGWSDVDEILQKPMPSKQFDEFLVKARDTADAMAEITAKNNEIVIGGGEGGEETEPPSKDTTSRLDALRESLKSETQLLNEKLQSDFDLLVASDEANLLRQGEFQSSMESLQAGHKEALDKIEADSQAAKVQMISDGLNAATTLLSLGGKKTEKVVRALGVAEAIVKGGQAAVAAWASGMATGGPWAPAVAAAYTAASVVKTGAMIAKLKSGSKVTSGGGGSTAAANRGGRGGGNGGGGNGGAGRNVSISLTGEGFFSADQVRTLIEQINEATGDGVQLNAA